MFRGNTPQENRRAFEQLGQDVLDTSRALGRGLVKGAQWVADIPERAAQAVYDTAQRINRGPSFAEQNAARQRYEDNLRGVAIENANQRLARQSERERAEPNVVQVDIRSRLGKPSADIGLLVEDDIRRKQAGSATDPAIAEAERVGRARAQQKIEAQQKSLLAYSPALEPEKSNIYASLPEATSSRSRGQNPLRAPQRNVRFGNLREAARNGQGLSSGQIAARERWRAMDEARAMSRGTIGANRLMNQWQSDGTLWNRQVSAMANEYERTGRRQNPLLADGGLAFTNAYKQQMAWNRAAQAAEGIRNFSNLSRTIFGERGPSTDSDREALVQTYQRFGGGGGTSDQPYMGIF